MPGSHSRIRTGPDHVHLWAIADRGSYISVSFRYARQIGSQSSGGEFEARTSVASLDEFPPNRSSKIRSVSNSWSPAPGRIMGAMRSSRKSTWKSGCSPSRSTDCCSGGRSSGSGVGNLEIAHCRAARAAFLLNWRGPPRLLLVYTQGLLLFVHCQSSECYFLRPASVFLHWSMALARHT
jgi:hypothetical protein